MMYFLDTILYNKQAEKTEKKKKATSLNKYKLTMSYTEQQQDPVEAYFYTAYAWPI